MHLDPLKVSQQGRYMCIIFILLWLLLLHELQVFIIFLLNMFFFFKKRWDIFLNVKHPLVFLSSSSLCCTVRMKSPNFHVLLKLVPKYACTLPLFSVNCIITVINLSHLKEVHRFLPILFIPTTLLSATSLLPKDLSFSMLPSDYSTLYSWV